MLLRHNYHTGFGEIDLITLTDDAIHFVEVKAWQTGKNSPGDAEIFHPLTAFPAAKQKRLRRAALAFMGEFSALRGRVTNPRDALEKEHYAGILDEREMDPVRFVTDLDWSFDLLWARPNSATDAADATYSCEYFPSLF